MGRALLFAAIALALSGLRCADGFREDEMECEETMSYLAKCCPGFEKTQASCTYSTGGCTGGASAAPIFTVDESHCIEHESCDALRSTGVCARVAHLPAAQAVCP